MDMSSRKVPILITGAHRTGTTWVGKVLAQDPGIAYVSEPLHLHHSRGVLDHPVDAWYQYICDENDDPYYFAYLKTLQYNYQLWSAIKNITDFKSAGKIVVDQLSFLSHKILDRRILLKDPFAVFSVPWFIDRFRTKVLIMVRHPLALISSLQRLNWQFDFDFLLDQPLLMRDFLEPFRDEMMHTNQNKDNILLQGILLWRMIYTVVHRYSLEIPEISIIRHEDLSLEPVKIFSHICDSLDVGQTEAIKKAAHLSSRTSNPAEVSQNDEHAVYLDSRANLSNWRKRLSESDIHKIVEGTMDVAEKFYRPEEWKEW
jgi:hypothetical protein